MPDYNFDGYPVGAWVIEGGGTTVGAGSRIRLQPDFSASSAAYSYEITDGGTGDLFSGDANNGEVGDDADQIGTVRDADGSIVAQGQIYLEGSITLTAPDGSSLTLYTVEIGGVAVGTIADGPITPGVTYEVATTGNVSESNAPRYSEIVSPTYEQDADNTVEGGDFADDIQTGAGADTIYGNGGNDQIDAGSGDDYVEGGAGDDTVFLGAGNDTFGTYGFDGGNDVIYGEAGDDFIIGGFGDDLIYGGTGADTLVGGGGNDQLFGEEGSDFFSVSDDHDATTATGGEDAGGADDDILAFYTPAANQGISVTFTGAEAGNFAFFGTPGAGSFSEMEQIWGTGFRDVIDATADTSGMILLGRAGDDEIGGGSAADFIDGEDGADLLRGNGGDDVLYGGAGNDDIAGGAGNDELRGEAGDDILRGDGDADRLYGGTGNDELRGGAGNDRLESQGGDDFVDGGADADAIWILNTAGVREVRGGETGNDFDTLDFLNTDVNSGVTVTYLLDEAGTFSFANGLGSGTFAEIERAEGTQFADTIDASASSRGTSLNGEGGDDVLIGGSGSDTITGDSGADRIEGGAGSDTLDGGTGDDRIEGGDGDDRITTGSGEDVVVVTPGGGTDTVTDFSLADGEGDGRTDDQIDVTGLTNEDGSPVTASDVQVVDDGFGNAMLIFPGGERVILEGISPAQMSSAQQMNASGVPCFTAGTPIDTLDGPVPVERLRPGDRVLTRDAGARPVLWVGMRRLDAAALDLAPRLRPVWLGPRVTGTGTPMLVSPQHAVLARHAGEERLVRAVHLARLPGSGARIARGARRVTYVHVMLERHHLLRSRGVWSESFYPGPFGLAALDPGPLAEVLTLFPALARHGAAKAYGPTARSLAAFADLRRDCPRTGHAAI